MYIISAVIIIGSSSIISFILYRCWYKKSIRMKVPFVGVVYSRKETEIYETLMYKMVTKQINLKNRIYYF